MNTFETFEYLQKQGLKLTKADWYHLNIEGFLNIELTQTQRNFINKNCKVSLTNKGISVCA